jgi:hypothetical protein
MAISRYGYFASAWQVRQRLHVQGFTSARALGDLREGIAQWRDAEADQPRRGGPAEVDRPSPPDADEFVEALRAVVADQPVFEGVDRDFDTDPEFADDERAARVGVVVDELWRFVDTRSLLRLLLDAAPGETEVGLDLHELTGCCVELDPDQTFAESARTAQLAAVSTNAPLIVLTKGSTDSHLLQKAMAITHPHLVGFVKFIDLSGVSGSEPHLRRYPGGGTPAGIVRPGLGQADLPVDQEAGGATRTGPSTTRAGHRRTRRRSPRRRLVTSVHAVTDR